MYHKLTSPTGFLFLVIAAAFLLASPVPTAAGQWNRTYTGSGSDELTWVEPTADAGYIAAGTTTTWTAGGMDGWLVKMDGAGSIQWQRRYGDSGDELFACVKPTWDGCFVATGWTNSFGASGFDLWVVKVAAADGSVIWERRFGGDANDRGYGLVQARDGSYVVAGQTSSFHEPGDADAYVLKLNAADGTAVWERTYGGYYSTSPPVDEDALDGVFSVDEVDSGQYIAAGYTKSFGPGAYANTSGWLLLLNTDGSVAAHTAIGAVGEDPFFSSVTATRGDGGAAAAGTAEGAAGYGGDAWAVRVDASLNILYERTYGAAENDQTFAIRQTHEEDSSTPAGHHFILAGRTDTTSTGFGANNAWLLKTDSQLRTGASYPGTWQVAYGGDQSDSFNGVAEAYDGDFVAVGSLVPAESAPFEGWFVKVASADGSSGDSPSCQFSTDLLLTPTHTSSAGTVTILAPGTGTATSATAAAAAAAVATLCDTCQEDAYEEDDNCFTSATILRGGDSLSLNFCGDAADWVSFAVCEGRPYTLDTSGLGSSCDTVLELYGTDCTTLITSDDDGGTGVASHLVWSATLTGTVHAKVRQKNGTTGKNRGYTLTLTGDTTPCGDTTWSVAYFGVKTDTAWGELQTSDGGYLLLGLTQSEGPGAQNAWAVKVDPCGAVEWERAFGDEAAYSEFYAAAPTEDGGHLLAGTTDLSGTSDGWLVKVDASGTPAWSQSYPSGTRAAAFYSLFRTHSGTYRAYGPIDMWDLDSNLRLLEVDATGAILSETEYGGASADFYWLTPARLAVDRGSILGSSTTSFGGGGFDAWLLKVNPWGEVQWQMTYGDSGDTHALGLQRLSDGGYGFAGPHFDGSGYDGWFAKTDAFGAPSWQNLVGTAEDDELFAVAETPGAGLLAAGYTGDGAGYYDLWAFRSDASGNLLWQKRYDIADALDIAYGGGLSADGGFHLGGYTEYYQPIDPFEVGDLWGLRLAGDGSIPAGACTGVTSASATVTATAYPNAASTAWPVSGSASAAAGPAASSPTSATLYGAPPTGISNNTAGDASVCALGITVAWSPPADWGDAGGGTRGYTILRDGTPLASGGCSGSLSEGTLSCSDATATEGVSYTYTVRFTNGCGMYADSAGASATDYDYTPTPTISGGTTNTCPDTSVALSTEDGMTGYQWYLGGSPIPGATTRFCTATASGSYTVSYTESHGCSGTSAPHVVTILSADPSGFSNNTAADLDPCADTGVKVDWTAPSDWGDGGNGTRTFDVLRDGALIASGLGAGETSYTDTTGDNGTSYTYTVRATNGCNRTTTTTGAPAKDFVATNPSGLSNNTAADLDACADTGVKVDWTAPSDWGDGGTGTRTFDVLRDGTPIATGLSAATTSHTDTTGVNGTTYTYAVRATNGCALSSTTSGASGKDFVPSAPSGLANNTAADVSTCADTGVKVDWTAPSDWSDGGTGTRTFDVLRDGTPIATGLSAATTSYTDTTGVNGTTYTYSVRARNGCLLTTATTGASAADNDFTPTPTISGANGNTCPATTVTLTTQSGGGESAYQWYLGGNPISGAESSTYDASASGTYTVRYTKNGCTGTSAGHSVTLIGPPTVSTNNGVYDNICDYDGIRVSWPKDPTSWGDNGSGSRTYTVLRNGNPLPAGTDLPYGTIQFQDTTAAPDTTYTYSVRYTNYCGKSANTSGRTATDTLSGSSRPTITGNSQNTCPADHVLLQTQEGMDTYQWRKNDVNIPGANSFTYEVHDLGYAVYKVYVTSSTCNGTSLGKGVTIYYTAPSGFANNTATDVSTCADTGVKVDWTAPSSWGDGGTGTRTFDVLRDGTPIATGLSAATTSYTDTTGVNGTSYLYRVRASNGCLLTTTPSGASAADNDFTPTPTISGASGNTCPALTVTLTTQSGGGESGYKWYLGGALISGANSSTYDAGASGTYTVRYTKNGCEGVSAGHSVTIIPCAVAPVPDGRSGTGMLATKLTDSSLNLTYDTTTCPISGGSYNILYGSLADLSSYTFAGSSCGITAGNHDWNSLPSGDIFFLIVGKVGSKESSWGEAFDGSTYTQRSTNASGQCGASLIDTTTTCP